MKNTFKKLTATALAIGMALSMGTSVAAESNFSFSDVKAQVADLQASSTGWKTKDGKSYYYKSGKLLKNTYVKYKGYYYYVDKSGVWDGKTRKYWEDTLFKTLKPRYVVLSINSAIGKYKSDYGTPVDCSSAKSDIPLAIKECEAKTKKEFEKAIKAKKSFIYINTYNKSTKQGYTLDVSTFKGFPNVFLFKAYAEQDARLGSNSYDAPNAYATGCVTAYRICYSKQEILDYMIAYEDMSGIDDGNGIPEEISYLTYAYTLKTGDYNINNNSVLMDCKKGKYDYKTVAKEVISIYNSLGIKDSMTDLEKMERVYEWVVNNFTYTNHSSYISKAVMKKTGVCEDYSNMVYLLANMAGVDCKKVTGPTTEGDHTWNAVKIDGEWRHFDATWDDTGAGGNWDNFNKTEAEFSKDLSGSGANHGSNADDYIIDEFNLD